MKNRFSFIIVILLTYFFFGCSEYPSQKSDDFPTQILFQSIKMSTSKDKLELDIRYYSNEEVAVNNEIHYVVIKEKQYLVEPSLYSSENIITLDSPLEHSDSIKVLFDRVDGSQLVSQAEASFAEFILPVNNQVIEHSIEPIEVYWGSNINNVERMLLKGSCINSTEYFFDANEFQLLIPANQIKARNNSETECNVTISLFRSVQGVIDVTFAGGSFELEMESLMTVYLKGLTQ